MQPISGGSVYQGNRPFYGGLTIKTFPRRMKKISSLSWALSLAFLFTLPIFLAAQSAATSITKSSSTQKGDKSEAASIEEIEQRMNALKERLAKMDGQYSGFQTFEPLESLSNIGRCKTWASQDDQPILGIYPGENANEKGILVSSLVRGKGAESAGLLAGDMIVKVDGKDLTMGRTIRAALVGHKVGEAVAVVFDRDGARKEVLVTLSPGEGYSRQAYSYTIERDPCAVFIGVYTTSHNMNVGGVRVTGVIDDTPAKMSNIQSGDVILALDGQAVNSHNELARERDKHQPGDLFRLTILRDGEQMDVEAQFKACDKKGAVVKEEETVVVNQAPQPIENTTNTTQNDLKFEVFEAYPNPTFGPVTIRFEAEAVPTTVRITDMNGKTVFNQVLNNFGGFYNEQVNLANRTAGNYILSVEQGGKVQAKTLVLMPRA
jgi:S1-C subfamily serine protease